MKSWLTDDPAVLGAFRSGWQTWLALGLGSGLAGWAPGTAGTLLAALLAIALIQLPPFVYWIFTLGMLVLGVRICATAGRLLGREDHGAIVWDEMAAFWLVLGLVPAEWPSWLAAFVLFRFFDIVKPWPIRAIERRTRGGLGVMLDDVCAAGMTVAALWVLLAWWASAG